MQATSRTASEQPFGAALTMALGSGQKRQANWESGVLCTKTKPAQHQVEQDLLASLAVSNGPNALKGPPRCSLRCFACDKPERQGQGQYQGCDAPAIDPSLNSRRVVADRHTRLELYRGRLCSNLTGSSSDGRGTSS